MLALPLIRPFAPRDAGAVAALVAAAPPGERCDFEHAAAADLLAFELGNSSGVVVDGSGVIGRGGESISAGDGFRILIGEAEPVPKSAQRRTSQQDNNNKLWLH